MKARNFMSICALSVIALLLCASVSYADCAKCKTKKQEVCSKDCAKKDSATCVNECITQKCTKACNKEAKAGSEKVVVNQVKQPKKALKPTEPAKKQKQAKARAAKAG